MLFRSLGVSSIAHNSCGFARSYQQVEDLFSRTIKKGREHDHDLKLWKSAVKQELTQSHYLGADNMKPGNYSRTLHRTRLLDTVSIVGQLLLVYA